jgi:hypothetical protein
MPPPVAAPSMPGCHPRPRRRRHRSAAMRHKHGAMNDGVDEGDVAIVNSDAIIDERVCDGIGDGDGGMEIR